MTKISLTQQDIQRGKRYNTTGCALALAINRATHKNVTVGFTTVFGGFGEQVFLPPKARKFRQDFDLGKPVEPFEFELDI